MDDALLLVLLATSLDLVLATNLLRLHFCPCILPFDFPQCISTSMPFSEHPSRLWGALKSSGCGHVAFFPL